MRDSIPKHILQLRELGQSLWLDNITRALLDNGTLQGYCDHLAVTGLTHRQSYKDIFAITCIKTAACFFVIAVYYLTGLV